MKTKSLALLAPLLFTCSISLSVHAQETLAGVGAASGMGAALGGAASGVGNRARGSALGVGGTSGMGGAGSPDDGAGDGMPGGGQFPGGTTTTTTTTTTTRVSTPLAGPRVGGQILGQLLSGPRNRAIPEAPRRSPRGQAAYSRRVARLSPTARKRLVLGKYRIAPRGYLASYLPQDRYKFAKAWKYVSTETDNFYYRPQDMAARGFNPNRVIGFHTWQDAMLAGYRPDPRSKPEPGNQISYLATLTRDEPLTQYVEYIYAGQVSPASVTNTYNYVRRVKSVIDRNPQARKYQRQTVNSILMASLTGDSSLIPRQLGGPPTATAAMGGMGAMGARGLGAGGGAMMGGANPESTPIGGASNFAGASGAAPNEGKSGLKVGFSRPSGM